MNSLFSNVSPYFFRVFVIMLTISLISCGGDSGDGGAPVTVKQAEQALPDRMQAAESAVEQLKSAINQGFVRNAVILNEYARMLKALKPEMTSLVDNLAKDATTDGAMFKNLEQRLNSLKNSPELFETAKNRYQEANALIDAAQTTNFNNALTDVINVLADMSNGSLARINAQPKAESLSTNNAQDMGAGSQLIGNPAYGQWVNHGGTSIWEWYGMYAMFRDLVGGRNYSYDYWDRNRDWSYNSDIGYGSSGGGYGSSTQHAPKSKKYNTAKEYGVSKKSYGSSSAERQASTYSTTSKKTTSSSYSNKSSNVGGSFRNSSTYSRSSSGGK